MRPYLWVTENKSCSDCKSFCVTVGPFHLKKKKTHKKPWFTGQTCAYTIPVLMFTEVYCQLKSFWLSVPAMCCVTESLCLLFPAMLVNDELLHRLTNGKANLNKPLVIQRSSETSIPLDYDSSPEEVGEWLRGKGFSEPWVQSHLLYKCQDKWVEMLRWWLPGSLHEGSLNAVNSVFFGSSEQSHVWACWQEPSSSPSTRTSYAPWFQRRAPECTVSSPCRNHCWR